MCSTVGLKSNFRHLLFENRSRYRRQIFCAHSQSRPQSFGIVKSSKITTSGFEPPSWISSDDVITRKYYLPEPETLVQKFFRPQTACREALKHPHSTHSDHPWAAPTYKFGTKSSTTSPKPETLIQTFFRPQTAFRDALKHPHSTHSDHPWAAPTYKFGTKSGACTTTPRDYTPTKYHDDILRALGCRGRQKSQWDFGWHSSHRRYTHTYIHAYTQR